MKKLFLLALLINLLAGCSKDPVPPFTFTPKPQIEGFYTSDIDLFWQAYDYMSPNFTKENFQNIYINNGTAGLKDYNAQKNITSNLEQVLASEVLMNYYTSIRANSLALEDPIAKTKEGFQRLQELYPDTKLCDVYFLMGCLSAAGRVSDNGILIAAEFFTRTDQSDLSMLDEDLQPIFLTQDYIPSVVVHELVHQQQLANPGGSYSTLLQHCILEGMADYIARQVLPDDPFYHQHIYDENDTMEEQIWTDFQKDMDKDYDETDWLYSWKRTSNGYPGNTGYYVGYQICEAYAAQFDTKEEAIAAMLQTSDYVTLYNQSGYDGGK